MINPTGAAKAIKAELKSRFPGQRFSVKTRRFAGGNSVDVYCPFSFDREAVSKLNTELQKYSYGTFDALTDSSGCDIHPTLPQAKFVSVSRFVNPE